MRYMRHPALSPLSVLLSTLLLPLMLVSACSGVDTQVEADTAALGRVVVYRNGIAYFERKATVNNGRLVLKVPNDKVNDFLKSLTIVDAKTGKAMPLSFPTKRRGNGSTQMEMIVKIPAGSHDLVLSYITEAPAWKSSYRVMVDDNNKVGLEGWAIVDNTSGEDWKAVRVGVGSSSALSFRFDLRSIRRVHRQMLHSGKTFVAAPPRGGSVHQEVRVKEGMVMELADKDIPRLKGSPNRPELLTKQAAPPYTTSLTYMEKKRNSRSVGRGKATMAQDTSALRAQLRRRQRERQRQLERQKAAERRLKSLAKQLNRDHAQYLIEGYANPGSPDAHDEALERAHALRNQLIAQGVEPGRLNVKALGIVKGRRAGVRLLRTRGTEQNAPGHQNNLPVGESHFEAPTPMTVASSTSAMVPVLQQGTSGEIIYLYDAETERGDDRYAFKSIRFRNPTKSTLEGGPMTVYGSGRFIGEGLTAPIPPSSLAVIPFALDRQVIVERDRNTGDHIHRLLKLNRGVVTAEVQHRRTTKLKLTSRLQHDTRIFIKHTQRRGWKLIDAPKKRERLGAAWLFEIALPAGKTVEIKISEATPLRRTVDLRSDVGVSLVRLWLQTPESKGAAAKKIREVLALRQMIDKHRQEIASLRERVQEYRQRMNELHVQIVSLQAVKAGKKLLTHLKRKLQEISTKVQSNTIATVNAQERMMLARVRFQDTLSELTLRELTD